MIHWSTCTEVYCHALAQKENYVWTDPPNVGQCMDQMTLVSFLFICPTHTWQAILSVQSSAFPPNLKRYVSALPTWAIGRSQCPANRCPFGLDYCIFFQVQFLHCSELNCIEAYFLIFLWAILWDHLLHLKHNLWITINYRGRGGVFGSSYKECNGTLIWEPLQVQEVTVQYLCTRMRPF